tara:strand:- start:7105 stop:7572 length:468 start_codon:yes stop_codon:yes gene_type:complete
MYELSKSQYKTIWLSTKDAVASGDRKTFTYNSLPLIKVIGEKNILKINSITLSGAGLSSASGHNWTIKIARVKFNTSTYFNSDKNTTPTIAMINYDTNNSIQNGNLSLEIEKQDINEIILQITAFTGTAQEIGAIKSNQNIDFNIGLCIEEQFFN